MPAESVLLILSISHLSLVCIYILVHHRNLFLGQLIVLYAVCLMAYLLGTASGEYFDQNVSYLILRRFGSACAIIVWLIAHELFIDKRKIHKVVWLIAILYMVLRASGSYYVTIGPERDWLVLSLTWGVSQFIMLGFIVHALYIAIVGYESDLVATRRTDRIAFVFATAVQILIIFGNTSYSIGNSIISSFTNTSSPGLLIPTYIYSAYTYVYATFFLLWRLRISHPATVGSSALFTQQSDAIGSDSSRKGDDALIQLIKHSMEVDHVYLRNKLSVQDLANHVSSQEYLVRRAINSQMNYRNFSDFVNHYRVLHAAEQLKNTDEPVSNIGLEVGYTSLSAFHKAFKDKYLVTPKEFRIRERNSAPVMNSDLVG